MRLAAAGRTMHRKHRRRPIRPSVDPLDGGDVAFRNHEIRSSERRTPGQIESELDHQKKDSGPSSAARSRTLTTPPPSAKYTRPPHEVRQPRHYRRCSNRQAQDKVGPAGPTGPEAKPSQNEADQTYLNTGVQLAHI